MKLKYFKKPWDHQRAAVEWLMPRENGALFTDMGSGKTKICIDVMINKVLLGEWKRILIITKTKICERHTWEKEFEIFSPKNFFQVINLSGIPATKKYDYLLKRRSEGKLAKAEVIIINYESIWRKPFKEQLIKKCLPDAIFCDESHKIGSPGSKVTKYMVVLGRRVKNKYLVTGSPFGQNPLGIYAQYKFMNPEVFGTRHDDFCNEYGNYVMRKGMTVPILDPKNPYKHLKKLKRLVHENAFMIEIEQNLPEPIHIEVPFTLDNKTMEVYKEMRKNGIVWFDDESAAATKNILGVVSQLQKLTCGYLKDMENDKLVTIHTKREETFNDLLEDIPSDEPVVVFCKYTYDLNRIREVSKELGKDYYELSGRKDTVSEWVDSEGGLLAIQIQAGAEGLNELVKARYCIYYSVHVSLTLWQQSKKRLHRPGQTRQPVFYTLVATGGKQPTVDELIMSSLKNNEDIIEKLKRREVCI